MLAAFKFRNALDLAPALAEQLGHAVEAHAAPRPVLLLPTPLAPARLRERGHNQAWEIARRLSQRLAVPADASLLFSRNLTAFVQAFTKDKAFQIDLNDDIQQGALITHAGEVKHARVREALAKEAV